MERGTNICAGFENGYTFEEMMDELHEEIGWPHSAEVVYVSAMGVAVFCPEHESEVDDYVRRHPAEVLRDET